MKRLVMVCLVVLGCSATDREWLAWEALRDLCTFSARVKPTGDAGPLPDASDASNGADASPSAAGDGGVE